MESKGMRGFLNVAQVSFSQAPGPPLVLQWFDVLLVVRVEFLGVSHVSWHEKT